MTTLPIPEQNRTHLELDRVLEIMSHYDSADENGKRHITEEVFGFLDFLAGPLIEKQLRKEGQRIFPRADAFHLHESARPANWPSSDEEQRVFRARVLIALVDFLRVPLNGIGFPVAGVNRDLLASTCDHKYTPKYLPVCQRGPGKDDNDDRRIMARRKFTLGVYAEAGSTKKSIKSILEKYQEGGVFIMDGTWKNLREGIFPETRKAVQEAGEDDTDYSGYDLPDDLQELIQIAVQLK